LLTKQKFNNNLFSWKSYNASLTTVCYDLEDLGLGESKSISVVVDFVHPTNVGRAVARTMTGGGHFHQKVDHDMHVS